MNKKTIIIICALIAVLAVAAAALITGGTNSEPNLTIGADELIIEKDDDTAVIVDFDTGSIIQTPESKPQTSSAVSETVGESDISDVSTVSQEASAPETESETSSADPDKQTMSGFSPWQ